MAERESKEIVLQHPDYEYVDPGEIEALENNLLIELTKGALSGSAAAGVFRHDFNVQKTAELAVKIAKAAMEELKKV